jgi:hypothetical protein
MASDKRNAGFSSLKVLVEDQQLIAKISGLRTESIAKLFAGSEVRGFFEGMLRRELEREAERLSSRSRTN